MPLTGWMQILKGFQPILNGSVTALELLDGTLCGCNPAFQISHLEPIGIHLLAQLIHTPWYFATWPSCGAAVVSWLPKL